jgi:Spy/CpxP family protein refolding chaperone
VIPAEEGSYPMKTTRIAPSVAIVTSAVLALWAIDIGYTQEANRETQAHQDAGLATRGRLPNHYGGLGLTDAQRERIYEIQRAYRARLVELQEQLEDLRQQQTLEIQEVLTPVQKQGLVQALKHAAERRAAKKKATNP